MTDKTISAYQAGEFLQFQRDVLPENTARFQLGTQTNPFYALHAQNVSVNWLPTFTPPSALTDRPFAGSAELLGTCFFMFNTSLSPNRWQLVIVNGSGAASFTAFTFVDL